MPRAIRAEFAAKLGIVLEEVDETVLWLEILVDADIVSRARMSSLLGEANELLAIFGASVHTARSRAATKSSPRAENEK